MRQPGEIIRNAISSYIAANIHTALPGIVESYNYAEQRATIQPAIRKYYKDGEILDMPVIANVPVIFPRSGGASLTFPVNQGDSVLIIFSERALENWLSSGGLALPGDPRKFDLADAVAIPGLYPFNEVSLADDNESALLQLANAKIRIKNGTFAIGTDAQELLDLLTQVIDALIATTIPTAIGPQLLSKSLDGTFLGIKNDLATIKGSI